MSMNLGITSNIKLITSESVPDTTTLSNKGDLAFGKIMTNGGQQKHSLFGRTGTEVLEFVGVTIYQPYLVFHTGYNVPRNSIISSIPMPPEEFDPNNAGWLPPGGSGGIATRAWVCGNEAGINFHIPCDNDLLHSGVVDYFFCVDDFEDNISGKEHQSLPRPSIFASCSASPIRHLPDSGWYAVLPPMLNENKFGCIPIYNYNGWVGFRMFFEPNTVDADYLALNARWLFG